MKLVIEFLLKWIFRGAVVKFLIVSALFVLIAFLVPYAVGYLGGFTDTSALTSAFTSLPPGVWYFIDLFRLDFGIPLAISAFVARFLIRRLPVIG